MYIQHLDIDMTLSDRVKVLRLIHGSYRAVSDITGIDHGYLHRLASGQKQNPSDETIEALGLVKIVSYELEG